MKATALLEKQHRKVEEIFSSLEASRANAKLVEDLATALTAHEMIEEEAFYPEAKRIKRNLVLESHEAHEMIAHALKRLVACDPESESFPARVKVTRDAVKHHVQQEEQELFPAITAAIGEDEDEALGKRMEERFKELTHLGYEGALAARKAKRTHNGDRATGKAAAKKKVSHAHQRGA